MALFLFNQTADQQAPQPPFCYCCKLLAPGSTTDVNRERPLRCPDGTLYSREIIDLALESAGATLHGERFHARLKVAPADAHDWKATP
jgi:hypothetical protein